MRTLDHVCVGSVLHEEYVHLYTCCVTFGSEVYYTKSIYIYIERERKRERERER